MKRNFWVVASTGKVMSEPYFTKESAQSYADSLAVDFQGDGTSFWVVDSIG